ncbi:11052_t:CDS:2 [Funneliformis geosporum]|uniref:11052_t:CDS:1 n=1 Tax=Funneliformis geosporum TaxID=1117311 RepID=A0A9W4WLC7_9GLOM|nr:11052_t:CDS:2 [Funneliformis geosporum]
MNRQNGHNHYGGQQLWIKIDLREIYFFPSRDIIRRYQCRQIELLLKYTIKSIAIDFIEGQELNEVRIPIEQVVGFKVIQDKYIEIEFRKDFHRTYFVHDLNQNTVFLTRKDPTGYMEGVTKIIFTPCEKVHPMTIFMFEVGIKWMGVPIDKDKNYETGETKQVDKDLITNIPPLNYKPEYNITCYSLNLKRAICLQMEESFLDLLKLIHKKLGFEIASIKYKDVDGNLITVEDEEDWDAAKLNFKWQDFSNFEIYVD